MVTITVPRNHPLGHYEKYGEPATIYLAQIRHDSVVALSDIPGHVLKLQNIGGNLYKIPYCPVWTFDEPTVITCNGCVIAPHFNEEAEWVVKMRDDMIVDTVFLPGETLTLDFNTKDTILDANPTTGQSFKRQGSRSNLQ